VQARAKEAKVLTVNHLPAGTVVLGRARRCATPGCRISFVPTHPRQKYHSKSCAEKSRRQKRAKFRQAAWPPPITVQFNKVRCDTVHLPGSWL